MSDYSIDELAKLARLELTEAEKASLGPEIGRVLEFVAALVEVDVSDIEPVATMNGLDTVSAEDHPADCLDRATVLERSPSHNAGFVKVPKVLE